MPFFVCQVLLTSLLLTGSAVKARNQADTGIVPVRIIRADRLSGSGMGGSMTSRLSGNVVIEHGGTRLMSDDALYDRRRNLVTLTGHVRMTFGVNEITSDTALYYAKEKKVDAKGDIVFTEDTLRTSRCRHLVYHTETEQTVAEGDIRVDDHDNDIRITGGYGEYTEGRKFGFMTQSPVLARTDSAGNDVFSITCLRMEFLADSHTVSMLDSVRMEREGYRGTCVTARYNDSTQTLFMTGTPVIASDEHTLSGDSIFLVLNEFRMESLSVTGRAREEAFSTDSLTRGQTTGVLTGKDLAVTFSGERIDRAVIDRNAVSLYYDYDEKGALKGTNEVSGRTITLTWDDDGLKDARVTGAARGGFHPEAKR